MIVITDYQLRMMLNAERVMLKADYVLLEQALSLQHYALSVIQLQRFFQPAEKFPLPYQRVLRTQYPVIFFREVQQFAFNAF